MITLWFLDLHKPRAPSYGIWYFGHDIDLLLLQRALKVLLGAQRKDSKTNPGGEK